MHLILPEAAHLPVSSQSCSVAGVQNISPFPALWLMAVGDMYAIQLQSGDRTIICRCRGLTSLLCSRCVTHWMSKGCTVCVVFRMKY